ncbi:MAG: D-alanyl-D-alanine carboxypeptidase/D-alanyl-D-alanine-endopeptidase [Pseudomonadota bacterium]
MSRQISRRGVIAGLLASGASPVLARAPEVSVRPPPRGVVAAAQPAPPLAPPPYAGLLEKAGLGGPTCFAVADAKGGDMLEAHEPAARLPTASVAKAATAWYALNRLGPAFRFRTRLIATAPIVNGRVDGDLILVGGGDPTLNTDDLGALAAQMKEAGVVEVTGKFRVRHDVLPSLPWIDPDQPDQVAYNPAVGGLNLNFNRVHFEWRRAKEGYDITMQARARKFRPGVGLATMEIVDRSSPVFAVEHSRERDAWSVARRALGNDGARWLPISRPAEYAAEVFMTLARSHGIVLKRGADPVGPVEGAVIAAHASAPLPEMLTGMLRYSTNLTAEMVGLTATLKDGTRPASLIRSARAMNKWFASEAGTRSTGFVDHSGLGYGARVTAPDMVRILQAAARDGDRLKPLLREVRVDTPGVTVVAKTGTLNFVSGLAGYIEVKDKRPLAFAIFSADMPRRDAVPIPNRERPPGTRGWSRRARALQRDLIARWVTHTV